MTSSGVHLPNAKQIDRLLNDLRTNLDRWNVAEHNCIDSVFAAELRGAWSIAWDIARDNRSIIWDILCDPRDNRNTALNYAVLALIAYDDCAYLLDRELDYVEVLARLGDARAILLYPACYALHIEPISVDP